MEIYVNERESNIVTAYGNGYIEINKIKYSNPILINNITGVIECWIINSIEEISSDLLLKMCSLIQGVPQNDPYFLDNPDNTFIIPSTNSPEILIIGTGKKQKFLPDSTIAPLLQTGIGIEVMDTYSATHTYNITTSEGRRIVAGLFPP